MFRESELKNLKSSKELQPFLSHTQVPTTGEAIQKLRDTEEMLLKKQDFLEKKIEGELKTARTNAKTNKRAALQARTFEFGGLFERSVLSVSCRCFLAVLTQ